MEGGLEQRRAFLEQRKWLFELYILQRNMISLGEAFSTVLLNTVSLNIMLFSMLLNSLENVK